MCDYKIEIRKLLQKNHCQLKSSHGYDFGYYQILGTREKQEDCICCLEEADEGNLFAVLCDGIGGLTQGNLASSLSVYRMLERYFEKGELRDIHDFLQNSFIAVDKEIYSYKIKMGTTMVSILIKDKKLYFASVGDSTLMIWRNKKIYSLLRKHTYGLYLKYLKSENRISCDELLEQNKNSETFISFIGKGEISIIDINENPYQLYKDDIVILCSDGVLNTINNNLLEKMISDYHLMQSNEIINKIFDSIIKSNNKIQDNASLILIKVR